MTYKITVVQLVPDSKLDHDDREENPSGKHFFEASSDEKALDEFHLTIPIANLDDFEIDVEEVV